MKRIDLNWWELDSKERTHVRKILKTRLRQLECGYGGGGWSINPYEQQAIRAALRELQRRK